MGFGTMTYRNNKVTFRNVIRRKQNLFKRFKKRFNASNSYAERQFLKAQANRVVSELRQFARQWKRFGFGKYGWITKGCTTTSFNVTKVGSRSSRRTTSTRRHRKSTTRYSRRSTSRRTYARRTRRTSARRRSWAAW